MSIIKKTIVNEIRDVFKGKTIEKELALKLFDTDGKRKDIDEIIEKFIKNNGDEK